MLPSVADCQINFHVVAAGVDIVDLKRCGVRAKPVVKVGKERLFPWHDKSWSVVDGINRNVDSVDIRE